MSAPAPYIRPAAVAGTFYPADGRVLARQLDLLLQAVPRPDQAQPLAKAIIAPHAGYVYSGPIAARAYAQVAAARDRIKRVVLLGPAHRTPLRGLALPTAWAMETPLGPVPVADEAHQRLRDLPQVTHNDAAHAHEHSLEVHLPFLQTVLGDFELIPLVVGDATSAEVAEVLDRLWGGDETLIVISSDLSHYLPYAQAQATDRASVEQIVAGAPALNHHQACGATPVNGLMLAAEKRGLTCRLLDLRNSGDTAGDKTRVVGYASLFYTAPTSRDGLQQHPANQFAIGAKLLQRARQAIAEMLGMETPALSADPPLHEPGACFVTLTHHGRLRGCMGSLEALRLLDEDVRANARAAAFLDPRFEPLTAKDYPGLRIEVSLLSAQEPLIFASEREALAQLRPGLDGVVLQHGSLRSTFLPQVWESLPTPRQFLSELKRKAGLQPDFWDDGIRLSRYQVSKWTEPEV